MSLSTANLQSALLPYFGPPERDTVMYYRMLELEKLLDPRNSNCGDCKFYRNSGCLKSTLCMTRMVRKYPLPDSEICDRYKHKPNHELNLLDQEYVYLKLHTNL
jgi:hypothetical protein